MRRFFVIAMILVVASVGALSVGILLQSGPTPSPTTSEPTPNETTQGAQPSGRPSTNPFGAFFNVRIFDLQRRIELARELNVSYLRSWSALVPAWNGDCPECQQVHDSGLKFVLTIRNSNDEARPSGPVTDLNAFKQQVAGILDRYKPALAVVENEENTTQYWTGTAEDYMTELKAVCEVAHPRNIPCANGGLLMSSVTWLVYFHYLDAGQTSQAESFATRGLEAFQQQRLTRPGGEEQARQVADITMQFVKLYKAAGADFMNIHWYGSDPSALEESVAYMEGLSGLPVTTNEIGQRNLEPSVTTGLMSMVVRLELPFAVWYGADARLAKALVDPDGSLRPTGEAFRSFTTSHYG